MFRLSKFMERSGSRSKYFHNLPNLHSVPVAVKKEASPNLILRRNFQVTIIGGSNPTAQSLSLVLKQHPSVTRLMLFDLPKSTNGVALDLSHIPSQSKVEGRADIIEGALQGSHVVVLASAEPRILGQTDYDLFKTNANHLIHSVNEICKYCPQAFIVNLTEPINYTTTLISLVLENNRADKSKVFGVTGRDALRAQACLQSIYRLPQEKQVHVPVICGQSKTTLVPLLSHITPWFNVDNFAAVMVTENVRGTESRVISLKGGAGQSSLANAYAGFNTVSSVLKALSGFKVKHIAFVANNEYDTKFFASPAVITKEGVSAIANYTVFSTIEAAYLYDAIKVLAKNVNETETYYKELTEKTQFEI